MPLSRNADYRNYLYTCNRCRSCAVEPSPEQSPLCPSYFFKGFFAYSGGGKGYVAQGILEKKVKPSAEVLEVAMNCLLCGACSRACPPGFDTMAFIRDLRDHLVSAGYYFSPAHRTRLENLRRRGNPFGRPLPSPPAPRFTGEEELLVFQGCRERIRKESDRALQVILDAADVTWGVMPEEPCCGAPLLDLGDKKGFWKQARKVLRAFTAAKARRILALCPHCAAAFAGYSEELEDFETEVVSVPSFVAELLGEERIKPQAESPLRITYHDPCHLARDLEESDKAREVFAALPGVELREMPRHGEWGWCCGAGGGMAELVPALAEYTAAERLREVKATQVQALVTACGYCADFLGRKIKGGTKLLPLLNLVAGRLA